MVKTMHANLVKEGDFRLVEFVPSDETSLFDMVDINTHRKSMDQFRALLRDFLATGNRWMELDECKYLTLDDDHSKIDQQKVRSNRGQIKGILLDILQIDGLDTIRIYKLNRTLENGKKVCTLVLENTAVPGVRTDGHSGRFVWTETWTVTPSYCEE